MNDKTSPTPASTPPGLTPAQAGRYDRARAVLQDSSEGKDAVNVAYHVGALEIRLGDVLALVRELSPRLTPAQARRVERARTVLQDTCSAEGGISVAYHAGALEWQLGDMLTLIRELTGGES